MSKKGVKPMAKPKYIMKAISDTTLSQDKTLINQLISLGWKEMKIQTSRHHGVMEEPFLVFHRSENNPIFSRNQSSGRNGKTQQQQNPSKHQPLQTIGTTGAKTTMGVPIGNSAPAPLGSGGGISVLSQIQSLTQMRYEDDSFLIGFDTEFYYTPDNQRKILSWQFAFVSPDTPDKVEELLVFATTERKLTLSLILAFIVETWGIGNHFELGSTDGIPYYSTRCWIVPVMNQRKGDYEMRKFFNYDDAVAACDDKGYKQALIDFGNKRKCIFDYVDDVGGKVNRFPRTHYNNIPLGYINDYTHCNKFAIPITLVCHSGTADLTTLSVDDTYEKDLMKKVSSVQGGLVTLKEFHTHNPQLSKYWNLYPFRISVRDTMCFASDKSKSLATIGQTIGVPKLDVQFPFSKNDMLTYMRMDIAHFSEYAINDSIITLLYSSELWGYNTVLPVTITSASTRVAVPVLKQHFGVAENDDEGFNRKYRGLHKVKKGLAMAPWSRSGYLENVALEPVSHDAWMLQEFARNAYKGGYNGCFRPGYFECDTYDYDLENAYPTCMSLVCDVDWENPVTFEVRNQPLNKTMIRSAFDPVFAYVTFKFPDTVKAPCIPVSIDGSLIYPQSSGSLDGVYASAPELWLAMQLGAEVYVKRLIVGTILADDMGNASHSLFNVVKQLISDRNLAKSAFGKGSLFDLLMKLANNGLYGKTAQNVIDKHSWSAASEDMENIGGSRITSPTHSCIITAGVRAVLLATINQIENLGYRVFSVTTDGFISDIPEDLLNQLDLYGLARYFRGARRLLTGSDEMWAMKHQQNDLLNLTTRGNASMNTGDKATGQLPGVMAHNSFVTGEKPDSKEDRTVFMVSAMTRNDKVKTMSISFEKFKNLARKVDRTDFYSKELIRYLSMDFDLKRKPLEDSLVESKKLFADGTIGVVACFDTVPYADPDEFSYYKSIGRSCKVLRTIDNWIEFFNKIQYKKDGVRRNVKDYEWTKLFSCIMAFRLGVPLDMNNGSPVIIPYLADNTHTVAEKVAWINKFNTSQKKFTENTWKDCRKQQRQSQMLPEHLFKDLLMDMINDTPTVVI